MKNIKTIFLKEMRRIFTDTRMLFSLFLPGVLIFVIYTLMGKVFTNIDINSGAKVENATYKIVYTDNFGTADKPKMLTFFDSLMESEDEKTNTVEYTSIAKTEYNTYKTKLENNEFDVLISFTDNFEDNLSVNGTTNNVTVLYNGSTDKGTRAYTYVYSCVDAAYKSYTINFEGGQNVAANVSDQDSMMNMILGMIVPMVTTALLFSTVISICPESIAGEKERGTLANLLLTPIKRSELVVGKILSLSTIAILSGLVTFAGLILSLPNLIPGATLSITAGQTILFLLIIISTLLLLTAFGTLVSSFAMSIKEATSWTGPLIILFMMLSIIPSIMGIGSNAIWASFIPIFNVSSCMTLIMNGTSGIALPFALTIVVNLVFTALLMFAVTKVFKKEKYIIH